MIELPWGAWYQDATYRLEVPDTWSVDVLPPAELPVLRPEQVHEAIHQPVDSPPLRELATDCRSACIAVDDLARPTRAGDIIPHLLEQLHEGGIPRENISIVVAVGSHGQLTSEQLRWKLGPNVVGTYRVECHNCRQGLAATGIQYGRRELQINRTFYEADLKLAVGSTLPHSFAGYSGGAKLVIPGLADLDATARSHKFVQMGLRGGVDPNKNRFRTEIEALARSLGLRFVVCVVTNIRRETVGVFAGDLVTAHRRACGMACEAFDTSVSGDYDCLVLNAYPKDVDLIQAQNVFVALKAVRSPVLRNDGVFVLTTAASEGLGRHGLFGPDGVSYRRPRQQRRLGDRELWLYAPNSSRSDVRQLYWEGYPVFQDHAALGRAFESRFPQRPVRAGVLPCAPMQQLCLT